MAMGLMAALSMLLDHWRDIRVYPLMAAVPEDEDAAYTWAISDSQFDELNIEGLDDNTSIWGKLTKSDAGWELSLEIDYDEQDDMIKLAYSAADVAGIVNALPKIATDIAEKLGAIQTNITSYTETTSHDDRLIVLLSDVFEWQKNLFLSLWGQPYPENEISTQLNKLIDAGKAINDEFAAWCVGGCVAHAMQKGYEAVSASVAALSTEIADSFAKSSYISIYISNALFELGYAPQAYSILEAEVSKDAKNPASWIMLADLYRRGGHANNMIDTFQRAIEEEAVNSLLYRNYGMILELIDAELVTEFILIDPEECGGNYVTWEAVEAYKEAEKLEPNNLIALRQRALLLLDLGEINAYFTDPTDVDEFFNVFEKLVKADETGEHLRAVIDNLYVLDDIEVAIDIIEEQIEQYPDRVDLVMNLALAYINNDEGDIALEELQHAEAMTDDPALLSEIEHMMLIAENPEFEAEISEIETLIGASSKLNDSQFAFLEDTIAAAPGYVDAYVILARAYLLEDELSTALETLLDGEKKNPTDPDILLTLGKTLWDAEQYDEAFSYLEKGIKANPQHVPLLSLMGYYLFEDEAVEEARVYLMRAESINPRHPSLASARKAIADIIANQK